MDKLEQQDMEMASTSAPETLPTASQQQSPLLGLPAEIRAMIYRNLFTCNWIRLDTAGPLDAPLFYDCCSPLDDSHAMQVYGLILSCRQLYAETMGLYYPTSTFYFYNSNAALRRLARMPPKYRKAMTDVRLCPGREMVRVPAGDRPLLHESPPTIERWLLRILRDRLTQLKKALAEEGVVLREGVLRIGSPPAELDEVREYAEVTEMFGRGPRTELWRGEGGRDGLKKSWSQRTQELTRYQSIMRHAVDMGEKGKRMRCWAEMEGIDI